MTDVLEVVRDPRRLGALQRLRLLDTPAEAAFDRLARIAGRMLDAPVALVSLVDRDRQFFKSCLGLPEPWANWRQTPLSHSFCQHVVASNAPLVVQDARQDPVFHDNPAIEDLGVIAYLGSPLVLPSGEVIGSFCVIDSQPRRWSEDEIATVRDLAQLVMTEIALRQSRDDLELAVREQARALSAAVRESEDRLHALAETSLDLICTHDLTGRLLSVNQRACDVLGYRAEQLIGRNLRELLVPDSRGEFDDYLEHIRLEGQASGLMKVRRRSGAPCVLQYQNTLRTIGVSEPLVYGTAQDVSEQQQIKRDLRATEARFRATFEQAAVGIAHVTPNGRFLRANDRLCSILGYPRAELLARRFQDITYPEDLARDLDLLRQLVADEIQSYTLEKRYVRKDAAIIWGNLTVSLVRDRSGKPEYLIKVVEDITARKVVERELHIKDQAIATSVTAIAFGDLDGRILYANRAFVELWGYDRQEDILGRSNREFGADPATVDEIMHALVTRGRWTGEDLARRRDGSAFPVQLSASLVRDDDGTPLCTMATFLELSELRRAETQRERYFAELQARNVEIENFVYTISHDLKTPLITIGGFASLLEKDLGKHDLAAAHDSLEEIRKAVEQMKSHIQDLLLLSRTGRVAMALEPVALGPLLQDVLTQLGPRIDQAGAQVAVSPDLPTVLVDAKGIRRVFTNLLDNALKYRHPDRLLRVEIGSARKDSELRLFVRDNGQGIKPAYQKRIFGLFQRADSNTEGAGVGLAISRRVIEVHGGQLWVESTWGEGSTFWISLPASAVVT